MSGTFLITAISWCAVTFGLVRGDFTFIGSCPAVSPMADFDLYDFLGLWYTIEKSQTTLPCLRYGILESLESHGHFEYYEIGTDRKKAGELIVSDRRVGGMLVRHGKESKATDFVVLTTDYWSYAGVVEFKQIASACRLSAKILSRKSHLDRASIDRVRLLLSSYNLTTPVHCYEPPTEAVSTTTEAVSTTTETVLTTAATATTTDELRFVRFG